MKEKNTVKIFRKFEEIDKGLLDQATVLYRELFGEKDDKIGSVWGEGAYCSKEGFGKKISLDEFIERKKKNRIMCKCGGVFRPFHTKESILVKIKDCLEGPSVLGGTVCFLLDDGYRVVGFAWASVRSSDSIILKLNESYEKPIEDNEKKIIKNLSSNNTPLLFFEEIGIKKNERGNFINLLYLVTPILNMAIKRKVRVIIFRTLTSGRIYNIVIRAGFKILFSKEDRILMYHKNIYKLSAILRMKYLLLRLSNLIA